MNEQRWSVTHLDEIPPVGEPDPGEWLWRPVRSHFGIGAFGVNAWIGRAAGDQVLEEHTETGTGHEELYVVLTGRARFELDGEARDCPAGTFVFIEDPGVRRTAFAEEPGTTVLAVGAKRGETFAPSEWEVRHTG
jgi:mannose-6-phosphate isomerase-like protein (cupin superfamily)